MLGGLSSSLCARNRSCNKSRGWKGLSFKETNKALDGHHHKQHISTTSNAKCAAVCEEVAAVFSSLGRPPSTSKASPAPFSEGAIQSAKLRSHFNNSPNRTEPCPMQTWLEVLTHFSGSLGSEVARPYTSQLARVVSLPPIVWFNETKDWLTAASGTGILKSNVVN